MADQIVVAPIETVALYLDDGTIVKVCRLPLEAVEERRSSYAEQYGACHIWFDAEGVTRDYRVDTTGPEPRLTPPVLPR